MTPQTCLDEETLEDDVRYGIADCRKRVRSQRTTLRTQHHSPSGVSNGVNFSEARVESYAEILANVSMNQASLSRLVECLLGPEKNVADRETTTEQKEAAIT